MVKTPILRVTHGPVRHTLLQLHRLEEFSVAFDKYLAGEVPASLVKARARKMLEVGLPRLK